MIFFILELLLETGQVSLFEHPLLETYIELKWIKGKNTKKLSKELLRKRVFVSKFRKNIS